MRILSRTHVADLFQGNRVLGWEDLVVRAQVFGDLRVVHRTVLERFGRESAARIRTDPLRPRQLFEQPLVGADHSQAVVVLLKPHPTVSADEIFQIDREIAG